MNYKTAKMSLSIAIRNCQYIHYPILVNGQDFGDDLSVALVQVSQLTDKVEQLEKIISRLVKDVE